MKIERDISNDIEFKNSRANPFGWSQEEIWHDGKRIGWLYCGSVEINAENYRHELIKETEKITRLKIYRDMEEEDWKAVDFLKEHSTKVKTP